MLTLEITETAAQHIRKMLAKRDRGETGLRLGVKAGGCSGFEYAFGWETTPRSGDRVFEGTDGARVFVDPKSLRLLDGTVLDYDTSLLSRGFIVNNPHATSTCGCGTSFSVERPSASRSVASGEDA
jgi:iron-sulfur cluster assembly accessory protein